MNKKLIVLSGKKRVGRLLQGTTWGGYIRQTNAKAFDL